MRALTAVLPERNGNSGGWPALILLGIFGAALLYGDGIEAHIHDVEHRGAPADA